MHSYVSVADPNYICTNYICIEIPFHAKERNMCYLQNSLDSNVEHERDLLKGYTLLPKEWELSADHEPV